jgi:hypothetical protein
MSSPPDADAIAEMRRTQGEGGGDKGIFAQNRPVLNLRIPQ